MSHTGHTLHAENNPDYGGISDYQQRIEFFLKITHELRIPVTIIKEFTEILDKEITGTLNPRQKEYVKIIANNIERLLRLIDNFVNITRIETGTLRLRRSVCDVRPLLKNAVSAMSIRFSAKHISVIEDISDGLPELYVDPDAMMQIVLNCLDNARKFSPEGSRVQIKAWVSENRFPSTRDGQDALFYLIIQDFGSGISEKDIPHIFNRFYQGEDTLKERLEGTGLGLAIVKELVELHNGTVAIESKQNEGTTVSIVIPVYQREQQAEGVRE